jgi:signal transduction histidine kinase
MTALFPQSDHEQILQTHIQALIQLSQSSALYDYDLQAALQELTQVTAEVLQVDRVSVWRLNADRTCIQCLDLFELLPAQHSQGFELQIADYPHYFAAIASEPLIVADDARTHRHTCEFAESYLIPLDIYSMLDSGFQVDRQVGGVICCEQVGRYRDWSQADQNFVRSVANLISLIVESHRRQQQAVELQQAVDELKQTQIQMAQSEKMSALGNLVAGIAHEINNPVTSLSGNITPALNYIQDLFSAIDLYQAYCSPLNPELDEALEALDLEFIRTDFPRLMSAMAEASNRIQAISLSLRTFSRADRDQKHLFDLHEGLDSTLLILDHRLKANQFRPAIAVERHYANLPLLMCLPGQLNQVFMNLLGNAIDAVEATNSERSFAEIQANPNRIIIQTELDAVCLRIQISDNGMGIPESLQQRIFDRLFTTKAVGKGTGLGLAIAQQIVVEKHQGKLSVQSTPGQGTMFTVELPFGV